MTTKTNIPNFTADAQICVDLAKTIATTDGCAEVSNVHVVRAALHLHPTDAGRILGVCGGADADERIGRPPQSDPTLRMRPSRALAALLKQLAGAGRPVDVADLLRSILRRPCVRVVQLLASLGVRGEQLPSARTPAAPYRAAQEHLHDLHRLWCLRAAACDSAEAPAFGRNSNFTTSSVWSSVMALQSDIESRSQPPARILPVRSEHSSAREVLEGLIVHEFYGLGQHWAPVLEVRHLARLLVPGSGWLRALDTVTNTVTDLEARDLVERSEPSVRPRPADQVRLAERVVHEVLGALRGDPFTSEELDAFALCLRHRPATGGPPR